MTRPSTSFGESNWILQTYKIFAVQFQFFKTLFRLSFNTRALSINLGVKWVFLEIKDTSKCVFEDSGVSDWVFCSTVVSHLDDKISLEREYIRTQM